MSDGFSVSCFSIAVVLFWYLKLFVDWVIHIHHVNNKKNLFDNLLDDMLCYVKIAIKMLRDKWKN